ncbi:hypothetical protein SAMN02927914_06021 [Mesorhizobium qingshengii]|uniref:Uncharacterized protein n=1 Tax=Mesorhizobium qingshengii TaxID=1165689 RepID=A0A1G5ZTP7_9HYPH|nr:hypothetical protein SAMN02927914_06021 [Mesorhizobium qingshengii]
MTLLTFKLAKMQGVGPVRSTVSPDCSLTGQLDFRNRFLVTATLQWRSPNLKNTLVGTLAARETMYVNCGHPMCCKLTKLQALIDRLGVDHGSTHRICWGSLTA